MFKNNTNVGKNTTKSNKWKFWKRLSSKLLVLPYVERNQLQPKEMTKS